MGVPAFYRWLVQKYPNITELVKQNTKNVHITTPNPDPNNSGLEFDHFYLDMNGTIHPCFHPDSTIFPPTTCEDVFQNVYAYIDRLFSIVKPRKLLYLAIDGVTPRAKMNQQRSRRFKNAKENEIAEKEEKKLRDKYERMGKKLLPVVESQVSDSNVVTPGTEFMFELSNALKSYIVKKLQSDPLWKDIKVILSDATVPGEGEHKVMSFIRTMRSLPGYDPNTRHCLYGLDADLIMLALATHEIHFSILRENVSNNIRIEKAVSESTLQASIEKATTTLRTLTMSTDQSNKPFNIKDKSQSTLILRQEFEFVHIWILREYLELDMQIIDPPEKFVFDLERIIDDFIFLCLFVGNDFLPRMPTLEINEGGIDLLMHVYKNEIKNFGGYLVDMQRVNERHVSFIKLKRVEKFILKVGTYEDNIFKKRTELRESFLRKIFRDLSYSQKNEVDEESSQVCTTDDQCPKVSSCVEQTDATDSRINSTSDIKELVENTMALNKELQETLRERADMFKDGVPPDKVKLGSVGWKQRYYEHKFSVVDSKETETVRKEIVQKYTEGLCWVLMYYFAGVPSWNWYYSDYYGLCASELKGLSQVKVKFQKGSPFKPFNQLLAVLPPKSGHALPEAYRELMISSDSKITEFYPKDFEVDTDGKRFFWQGVCKLPFIDQEKLINATSQLEAKIDINAAQRNVESSDHLFQRTSNSFSDVISDYIVQNMEKREEIQHKDEFIMCLSFKLPEPSLSAPRLLEGVQIPEQTVFEKDISETTLWHEFKGRPPFNRPHVPRVQPQPSQRKPETDECVIHKHAGHGWSGSGRGKGNNIPKNQQSQPGYGQSSSSTTSRGWFKQHPTSQSNSEDSPGITPSGVDKYRCKTTNNLSQQSPTCHPLSYAAVAKYQIPARHPGSDNNPNSPQFTPAGRGRGRGYYRQNAESERSSQASNRWGPDLRFSPSPQETVDRASGLGH